jgi:hypothetical protein
MGDPPDFSPQIGSLTTYIQNAIMTNAGAIFALMGLFIAISVVLWLIRRVAGGG